MLFKNCTIKEFDNFQIWTRSNTEFIRGGGEIDFHLFKKAKRK